MKNHAILKLTLIVSFPVLAQSAQPSTIERGPHHRVVQILAEERNERGEPIVLTNSLVELATGLHYRDPVTGEWRESLGAFEISAEGYAVARQGQHQVILAPDINSANAVDLLTPDGRRLLSNPMGLSYFDAATGKNVLLAELKECIGELVASNVVVYPDAFDTIRGAIRYTFTLASFEQDIILFESPVSPAEYGLDPDTTTLEFYTEFHQAPTPREARRRISANLEDTQLDFGSMQVGMGRAFSLQQREFTVPVAKAWQKLQGRRFLIEAVEFRTIETLLKSLPAPEEQAGIERPRRRSLVAQNSRQLPAPRLGKDLNRNDAARDPTERGKVAIKDAVEGRGRYYARVQGFDRGLVLDYTTVNSTEINYVFIGDETYNILANVYLGGTTTIEGGAIIKLAPGTRLTIQGPLICRTEAYRPALFTSRNDNYIGQTVPDSTGQPAKGDYAIGLELVYGPNFQLENLRFRYADTAVRFVGYESSPGKITVRNSQFIKCNVPFRGGSSASFNLRNILASDFVSLLSREAGTVAVDGQHVTAHLGATLGTSLDSATFRNCLFTDISANTLGYTPVSTPPVVSSAGIYQVVGAGFHYLAPNSAYRNYGTTSGLEPSLADDLKERTTFAPAVLTDNFSLNTYLSPRAPRDTDAPDVGYHYDPLDYCWSGLQLADETLTLVPGVAVGLYGAKGTTLRLGARFISEGSPFQVNRLVRFNTVQEQPTGHTWNPPATGAVSLLDITASESLLPEISLRFTAVSAMADSISRRHVLQNGSYYIVSRLALRDCKLQNVHLYSSPYYSDSRQQAFSFTNNIFDRCYISLNSGYSGDTTPVQVDFWNNLFTRSTVLLSNAASYPTNGGPVRTWYVKDNLFDRAITSIAGHDVVSHNGFYSTIAVGSNSKTLSAVPDYVTGPLGSFYYPVTGGNLSQLINAGSRPAPVAGLFHFTLRADGLKEGHDQNPLVSPPVQPTVDIGFHYPAVNSQFRASESFHGLTDRPITWKYQYSTVAEGDVFADLPMWSGSVWFGVAGDFWCQAGRDLINPWLHPGQSHDAVRTFVVPLSGTVTVTGLARDASPGSTDTGVKVRVLKNRQPLTSWITVPDLNQPGGATPSSVDVPGTLTVQAGDQLQFQVSRVSNNASDGLYWDPVITYQNPELAKQVDDTDFDSVADYAEDWSGDGVVYGESDPGVFDFLGCAPSADVMVVLGHPDSMSAAYLASSPNAREAATAFLSFLKPENDRAGLVDYGAAQVQVGLTADFQEIIHAVRALPAVGTADLGAAIRLARTELLNYSSGRRRVLVLFTDGFCLSSKERQAAITEAANAKNSGIEVFIVGFESASKDLALLRTLASGPLFYNHTADVSKLVFVYGSIARSLCRIGSIQPVVFAGADETIEFLSPTTGFNVEAYVVDYDSYLVPRPYTATWSRIDGPGDVTFVSRNIAGRPELVEARFTTTGTYRLHLAVNDGFHTAHDEVTLKLCSGTQRPLDVMLAIDSSRSMLTKDRIGAAKQGARDLVQRLALEQGPHQVGVLAFGGEACGLFPMTSDYGKVITFIDGLNAVADGTVLSTALQAARDELLGPRRNPEALPLIILVTDGRIDFFATPNDCKYYPDGGVGTLAAQFRSQDKIRIATICAVARTNPDEPLDGAAESCIQSGPCGGTCHTYGDSMHFLMQIASPGYAFEIDSEVQIIDKLVSVLDDVCRGAAPGAIPGPGFQPSAARANCDRFMVTEDSRQNLLDVLLNDTLRAGHSYQISLASNNQYFHGRVSLATVAGKQYLQYDPFPDYSWTVLPPAASINDEDQFNYVLTEDGLSIPNGTGSVTVWVTPENDPPVAHDDNFKIATSASSPVNLFVLQNDTDPDLNPGRVKQYDSLRIAGVSALSAPAGTVEIDPTAQFVVLRLPSSPVAGTYGFSYTVADLAGAESSARVTLELVSIPPALYPVTLPDSVTVLRNSQGAMFDPLDNDLDPAGDGSALVMTSVVRDPINAQNPDLGELGVTQNGRSVWFNSNNQVGVMKAKYVVRGAAGVSASGTLTILVVDDLNQPPVAWDDVVSTIESWPDFPRVTIQALDNDFDPEGGALTIVSWAQGQHSLNVSKLANPERLYYDPGAYRGSDTFTYTVADPQGNQATARIIVHVKAANNAPPIAQITNLRRDPNPYPETNPTSALDPYRDKILVVREAALPVLGEARDPDPNDLFQYILTLSRLAPGENDPLIREPREVQRIVAYTPVLLAAPNVGSLLGTFDLTTIPNGVYQVQLEAIGGADSTTVQKRFILDSDLKLGDFTFTVQDLSLPVDGLPLTVLRTYSSINAGAGKAGEFGPGWTYSLVDLDVELDEAREATYDDYWDSWFSRRINPDESGLLAGRNVTLTLPDGRRGTFYFSPDYVAGKVKPAWKTLPGIGARLQAIPPPGCTEEFINPLGKWECNGSVALDGYDFHGFKLTTSDGTEYIIRRDDLGEHDFFDNLIASDFHVHAYGRPYVSEIKQKTGDRIVVDSQGVHSYAQNASAPRKSLRINRENGRITSIFDPRSATVAALIYDYDERGDLRRVKQRVKTSGANVEYVTTEYFYDDPRRPHFLTSIVDPRGKRVTRNFYDDKGRIVTRLDASQIPTTFDYDTPVTADEKAKTQDRMKGRIVTTVAARADAAQVTGYDAQGNVVYAKDLYGAETVFAYDSRGTMTQETKFTAAGALTTTFVPSYASTADGMEYLRRIETTVPYETGQNPADFKTIQEFEPSGAPTKTVRPSGGVEVNTYDPATGRPLALYNKQDASGNAAGDPLVRWTHPSSGQETEETLVGKNGAAAVYQAMTLNAANLYTTGTTTLSDGMGTTLTGTYDANLRITALSANGKASSFGYDDLGRETSATYDVGLPSSLSISYEYDGDLDWKQVSAPTIGTMGRTFDDSGRLQSWQLQDGSHPSFGYDEFGRLNSETDSRGAVTRYAYEGAIKKTKRPGEAEVQTSIDQRGLVDYENRKEGNTDFEYYPDGSLKSRSQPLTSADNQSHAPSGGGDLQQGPAEWHYQYRVLRPTGPSGPAEGSATDVTDPLGRVSTSQFTKEGLLQSATGNSCCGNTQFTYLLDDPSLEGDDYPLTITDAGNRVRSFTYYLASDPNGSVGQLKTASDLAGKVYTLQYFKPDTGPLYTAQLKKVIGPAVPIRNQGNVAEFILQFTYDGQEREQTIQYAGLAAVRRFYYNTTTPGAVHLPSRIDLPNGGGIEMRYETDTGRLKDRYLKRSGQSDSTADEKVTYTYLPGDQVDKLEYWAPASSTIRQIVDFGYGRIVAADPVSERVGAPNHTLRAGDPVSFSSTGTLPGGIAPGATYFVLNPDADGFQLAASSGSGQPVNITSAGTGVHTVSDGDDWAVIARSEVNGTTTTPKAELIHRKRYYPGAYTGRIEEIGARAKSNGAATKTYVSEYHYNGLGHLQAINVYVETGLNPVTRIRKYRFEFERDQLGRLELRTAFQADSTYPDDDERLAAVVQSDYEYYRNPDGTPANGDFVHTIEHRGYPSGSVLERVEYVRGAVGEPTRVTWNDGTSVTVGYTGGQGLRITSEDFSPTIGVESSYGYVDNGSRNSKIVSGTSFGYEYDPGFKLAKIRQTSNLSVTRSYRYDAGGNLESAYPGDWEVATPPAPTCTMTYTVDDRLRTVTKGTTTTYSYDPQGYRVRAVNGATDRRFVVGPTSGTSLEVIHMITDASDAVKAVYIYSADRPLMRFEVDAGGNPINPVFYLEDGMGSVLALANSSGTPVARFRYDGFGNSRPGFADPASTSYMPAGASGDYRFHGAWLEAHSGFYHMRARDYDPETGRFLVRDPLEADVKMPESLHSYAFGNCNPYVYSDPAGKFTVIEINAANAIQGSLRGFQQLAASRAKGYAKDKIIEKFSAVAQDVLESLYPGAGALRALFTGGVLAAATKHESEVLSQVCQRIGLSSVRNLWFGVPIDREGDAEGNGVGCGFLADLLHSGGGPGVARPDFVLGDSSPLEVRGGRGRSVLLGDLKLSGNSLYNQYVRDRKETQFLAIAHYASKHTYTRTAVFLTVFTGNQRNLNEVSHLLRRRGFNNGVVFFVFAAIKNDKF